MIVTQEDRTILDVEEADLLKLAVYLRLVADEKRVWDAALDKLESDFEPDEEAVKEFLALRKYCEPSIRRKELMSLKKTENSRHLWRSGKNEEKHKNTYYYCDSPGHFVCVADSDSPILEGWRNSGI